MFGEEGRASCTGAEFILDTRKNAFRTVKQRRFGMFMKTHDGK
jgi:hypothetical protein